MSPLQSYIFKLFGYITQIVQIEIIWVLETAYGFDKSSVITALKHIELHTAFKLQKAHIFSSALSLFSVNNADFSDCLILLESKAENYTLATFDKKLGKLSGTQLISSK